jgi:hypothetical protein
VSGARALTAKRRGRPTRALKRVATHQTLSD